MSVFQTFTLHGETCYLLTSQAVAEVGVEFELPVEVERGLNGTETRSVYAQYPRATISMTALLTGSDCPSWRTGLQSAQAAPFAVPWWPLVSLFRDRASMRVNAGLWIAWVPDWSTWTVSVGSQPTGFADTDYIAPLCVGNFTGNPDPFAEDEIMFSVSFEIVDARPDSWIKPNETTAWQTGPSTARGTTPILPARINWDEKVSSGRTEYTIEREPIGYRREPAQAFYAQSPERVVTASFLLTKATGPDWIDLLRFFIEQSATTQSFWCPAALAECRLTGDVAGTDTSLSVDSISSLGANRYFLLDDLANRAAVKATAASNPLPLSAAVGQSFSATYTRIESLVLARFYEPKFKLTLTHNEFATCSLGFRETPAEYAAASGEVAGVTFGGQSPIARLYQFTLLVPGSPIVSRYTSYEADLNDGTNTWTGAFFEHGEISESLNIEPVQVEIKTRVFSGNPLNAAVPFTLEFPLQLEIIETDLAFASPRRIFIGEVISADNDGPFIQATCGSFRPLAVQNVPRMLFGTRCPYNVYQGGCPAVRANYTTAGTVTANATMATTITVQSAGTAWTSTTVPAHKWAGGLLSTGSGSTLINRWIADSTVPDGSGIVTLTLAQPITVASGASVSLLIQCDRQYSTCQSTFGSDTGNGAAFGGFPWLPVTRLLQIVNPNAGHKK